MSAVHGRPSDPDSTKSVATTTRDFAPRFDDPLLESFEVLPDAVTVFTPIRNEQGLVVDLRCEFANTATARIVGRATEELVGRSVFEVWPDLAWREVLETSQAVLDSGTAWRNPNPVSHAAGGDETQSPRYLDIRMMRLHERVLLLARDVTEWLEHDRESQRRAGELEESASTARAMNQLMKGMQALQLCSHVEEAMEVISRAVPLIFEKSSGAIYTPAPSGNAFASISTWGDFTGSDLMKMEDCWAWRSSGIHLFGEDPLALRCRHASPSARWTACIPLLAQGEPVALIHLENGAQTHYRVSELVEVVSTQWGLTIANLRLQESLRSQSVRDPLTGLFNRRFLDEALEEEVHRAERHETPLCLVMLDVDHFKPFNDTHGHLAGDTVLRDLGRFLLEETRGSDVVGRYGGEEFLMIMPHMAQEAGQRRIEDLLWSWRKPARLSSGGPLLPTISAGVAYYVKGQSSADLLGAADRALYEAKAAGRDRVVVSSESAARRTPIASSSASTSSSTASSPPAPLPDVALPATLDKWLEIGAGSGPEGGTGSFGA